VGIIKDSERKRKRVFVKINDFKDEFSI